MLYNMLEILGKKNAALENAIQIVNDMDASDIDDLYGVSPPPLRFVGKHLAQHLVSTFTCCA